MDNGEDSCSLYEEFEACERAALPKGKPVIRRSKEYPTTRTFMGSGQSGCCFCKGEDNGPVNCKRFATVEERKHIIREQDRSFVCLRPGHVSRNCRSAKCGNCNKRHHTSVLVVLNPLLIALRVVAVLM